MGKHTHEDKSIDCQNSRIRRIQKRTPKINEKTVYIKVILL